MMHSVWAAGDKNLEGDYRRVMAAGDLNITDGSVKVCYAAGDIDITRVKIKKLRCAGDITAHEVNIGSGKVAGDLKFFGICTAEALVSVGDLTAELLKCKNLVNGTRNVKREGNKTSLSGSVEAETFENRMPLTLNLDYSFKNIISEAPLFCSDEIKCEFFFGLCEIKAPAINAEYIFLLCHPDTDISTLTGGNITVSKLFSPGKAFKAIHKLKRYDSVNADRGILKLDGIYGDTVSVESVRCGEICANDVTVGDLCVIDRIEYKNKLTVSEKSVIGEAVKLC